MTNQTSIKKLQLFCDVDYTTPSGNAQVLHVEMSDFDGPELARAKKFLADCGQPATGWSYNYR